MPSESELESFTKTFSTTSRPHVLAFAANILTADLAKHDAV
ncbi:hypothetical protein [Neisseria sp. Dent CA1/247]|nr:hypothetical protein [Neisseria sp. Dent CA1/247]